MLPDPADRPRLLALGALSAALLGLVIALASTLIDTDTERLSADRAAEDLPSAPKRKPPPPKPVKESERDVAVPILAYQVVADPSAGGTLSARSVTKADFEAQMAWLNQNGYHAVTLQRVHDLWTKGTPLPEQPVVISFDDGYRSVHANALPAMRRFKWAGVLFLDLELLGRESEGGLSRRQVTELSRAGWEIDSRTINAREDIGRIAGREPAFFAYDTVSADAAMAAVKSAGYLGAVTTEPGVARRAEPFALNRVRIEGSDGLDGFVRKMTELSQEVAAGPTGATGPTGPSGTTP